ncbi:hypothetical protein OF83DRAFT_1171861 [Amylostereum chailletii]|nr:hypothetical protein OF83DRAFT_1171861 [Amylostereum chailletii]
MTSPTTQTEADPSGQSVTHRLQYLHTLLSSLPPLAPSEVTTSGRYSFGSFAISAEDVEDYGPTGAVNQQLENRIGLRANGPIHFSERGPDLVAVVDVLDDYLTMCPEDAVLLKWVDDLTSAAQAVYESASEPIPSPTQVEVPGGNSANIGTTATRSNTPVNSKRNAQTTLDGTQLRRPHQENSQYLRHT